MLLAVVILIMSSTAPVPTSILSHFGLDGQTTFFQRQLKENIKSLNYKR